MKTKWIRNRLLAAGMAGVMFLVTSCGTLMYPERKGQPAGRLDLGVVLMNGIGLFLFLVPGVIAFAVDFSNGTIYLPPGETSSLDEPTALTGMAAIPVPKRELTRANIELLVSQHTGKNIDLSSANVIVACMDGEGVTH